MNMNVEVVLQHLWKSSGITIRVLDHTNKQRCQLLFVEKLDKNQRIFYRNFMTMNVNFSLVILII
jgi:hypothetical protein